MKKMMAALTLASAFMAPTLTNAEVFVVTGDRLVGWGQWEKVVNDTDPSDGCGGLGLKEFDPTTTERIKKHGCGIIMIGEADTLLKDKDPTDGCGKIDLNFIMPKAREIALTEGCAAMLRAHPWD